MDELLLWVRLYIRRIKANNKVRDSINLTNRLIVSKTQGKKSFYQKISISIATIEKFNY